MQLVLFGVIGFVLLMALVVQKAGATALTCASPCCDPTAALPNSQCAADTCAFLNTCLPSGDVIASAAQQAGFQGEDLITAVAIALAESGGDPNIENPETEYFARHGISPIPPNSSSIGLWQIFRYIHSEFAATDLTDPDLNAEAAFSIYSAAGGFTPWSTYNNQAYLGHLENAAQRVNA